MGQEGKTRIMPVSKDKPKRKPGRPKRVDDPKDYVLEQLEAQTKLLTEIKEILDNTWRGRRPT